jgi:hypothetical protein
MSFVKIVTDVFYLQNQHMHSINSTNVMKDKIRLRIQAGNRSLLANKKLLKNKGLNFSIKVTDIQIYYT